MGWRRIKVVVELFDVLPVVSLMTSNTKETFLEYRILAVPQRQPKTETLVVIRDTSQTILAPPICARSRVLMGEMAPSVAICRVVLANSGLHRGRSAIPSMPEGPNTHPLPITNVRPPFLPMLLASIVLA